MAASLHGSARTTPRVQAELQAAQASSRTLAARYGLHPKTVAKWRGRTGTADAPMGPMPRSTTLTEAEEAVVVRSRARRVPARPTGVPPSRPPRWSARVEGCIPACPLE